MEVSAAVFWPVSAEVVEPVDAVDAVEDGVVEEVVDVVVPVVDPVDDEELDVCDGEEAAACLAVLSEWCTV